MTFTQTELSRVSAISAGHPLRGAVEALPAGDVAVIQMRNVDAELGVDWLNAARVTLPAGRSTNLLAPGDVIFTTRGTRNFALALHEVRALAVCSPHFFVIRLRDPAAILPEFVAWQMNQRPAQEYFQREATGSYILNIRREAVENLPLVLPPLDQQRAIVALAQAAIRLEAGSLDLLNAVGVGELIFAKAAELQREQCLERNLRRSTITGDTSSSSNGRDGPVSKSPGMTLPPAGIDTLQRVRQRLKPGS